MTSHEGAAVPSLAAPTSRPPLPSRAVSSSLLATSKIGLR
jgi:hypothetical protein